MKDLICISHLRWDFVWQRPQHLLSRLARQYRILFVEEPISRVQTGGPTLEVQPGQHAPGVTVVRMVQPVENEAGLRWIGFEDTLTQATYSRLLTGYLAKQGISNPLLWLYTPMALEFTEVLEPSLLIHDVMDQLSAFKGAPPNLAQWEEQLLRQADIVFTGGVSLYRAKKPFNSHTYLFPSGVAIEHWAKAQRDNFARPADLPTSPGPLLGYFGVIDERMDLALLSHLAQARPDWTIAMLGPVAKIQPSDLPQFPNLHFLGMKSYEELPAYLAYFDVALVPFALNDATRYLSPTKTLEYMAAHKPIVATPIPDLVELYGSVARVAETPADFVKEVEAALNETPGSRLARENELLEKGHWDNIAAQMGQLIEERLGAKL